MSPAALCSQNDYVIQITYIYLDTSASIFWYCHGYGLIPQKNYLKLVKFYSVLVFTKFWQIYGLFSGFKFLH